MSQNTIDFKTFNLVAPFEVADKKPILIRGRHGIGKSEIVYQIAQDLDLPVVERRASQMTEGDLMGLPSVNGNSTSWNPPDWFKTACDQAVLLFMDEIDRATIEVRQGIFELTDSRKLNGHRLHEDTVIFGAVNGGIHGAQYQVGEFDPAELDRWTVFDVEPRVEDWLDWASDKVDGAVWDFINNNHNHLEHTGDVEPNKVYPSRRSWKRLNDCLVRGKLLEGASSALYNLACAYVGFEAGVAFNDYVDNYERVVTVDDLLVKGKLDKVKDFSINEHSAMIEKINNEKVFNEVLSKEKLQNIAEYFVILPSELAMTLWQAISKCDDPMVVKENVCNFHECRVKGKEIKHYFAQMYS